MRAEKQDKAGGLEKAVHEHYCGECSGHTQSASLAQSLR
jgi:hypothetical protein